MPREVFTEGRVHDGYHFTALIPESEPGLIPLVDRAGAPLAVR